MAVSPDLFENQHLIVDNSHPDWTAEAFLAHWCRRAAQIDIATGYFEIGALLALDGLWQQVGSIRILMGDEVSLRTFEAFDKALSHIKRRMDNSIEEVKKTDDFLEGVPAIVSAIANGQIAVRVYRKRKFHAKAYILHPQTGEAAALVGSSNFTVPGLTQNLELNVQVSEHVEQLQAWFNEHWEEAEDISSEMLRVIERHTRDYAPFEIYARSMQAYFENHELSAGEWERNHSQIYRLLSRYQREGYHNLMRIAAQFSGGLLCDGVGLGKTFIGLMLIERLLFERKRVLLLVPKAARVGVWESNLKKYLPDVYGAFSNLQILNHTDLMREGDYPELVSQMSERADVVLIDEAHNFRNLVKEAGKKTSRTTVLYRLTKGKQVFLLTATPINNSVYDLMHLIEYFARDTHHFSGIGIPTLRGHFRKLDDALRTQNHGGDVTDMVSAERVLSDDTLFKGLVVQRSRAYVRRSMQTEEGGQLVVFPQRQQPVVAGYSLAATYGRVLDLVTEKFNKEVPLLRLPMYSPIVYRLDKKAKVDALDEGRQRQIVILIRTLLLKRFESSAVAFESTCEDLFWKLTKFIEAYDDSTFRRINQRHRALLERITESRARRGHHDTNELDRMDDDAETELEEDAEDTLSPRTHNITAMVIDAVQDVDELAQILNALTHFSPSHDDKLQTLIHLMQSDPQLSRQKVLIFSEFRDTAQYIARELRNAGVDALETIDSGSRGGIADVVERFSPYYNGSSSPELAAKGLREIRVLVATDVLSEGLNLQDATCIINYDLHWNPVRLMQRIGRVDRRLSAHIEEQLVYDHPQVEAVRGKAFVWNFLPPEELNQILSLYHRVTQKTLTISKTFGIEGRQLLTPNDDYQALREFNEAYEGATTNAEDMLLAYQTLERDYPDLMDELRYAPMRLFSGKAHPTHDGRAVFACYRLPVKALDGQWTHDDGMTRWVCYDLHTGQISDDRQRVEALFDLIRCPPDEPRVVRTDKSSLRAVRVKIEDYLSRDYLRAVNAPIDVNPILVAWMVLD